VWLPQPKLLKMLRKSIFDNFDEFSEIVQQQSFGKIFNDGWYDAEGEILKTVPHEFPKDAPQAYFLRMKHYLVSHSFDENEVFSPHFIQHAAGIAREGLPLNRFLNYTVEEFLT